MNIKNWSKKKKIIVSIMIFIFLVGLLPSPKDTSTSKAESNSKTAISTYQPKPSNAEQKVEIPLTELINYKIVYTLTNKRYDGGKYYYLLIDTVDLSNDLFKRDIKNIVNKLVKEYGNKVSIEFYDDMPTLEMSYKQYGTQTLGRVRTNEENKMLERHLIASYDGDLETDIYSHTLRFFLGAFNNTPNVGKYIETLEYIPQ